MKTREITVAAFVCLLLAVGIVLVWIGLRGSVPRAEPSGVRQIAQGASWVLIEPPLKLKPDSDQPKQSHIEFDELIVDTSVPQAQWPRVGPVFTTERECKYYRNLEMSNQGIKDIADRDAESAWLDRLAKDPPHNAATETESVRQAFLAEWRLTKTGLRMEANMNAQCIPQEKH